MSRNAPRSGSQKQKQTTLFQTWGYEGNIPIPASSPYQENNKKKKAPPPVEEPAAVETDSIADWDDEDFDEATLAELDKAPSEQVDEGNRNDEASKADEKDDDVDVNDEFDDDDLFAETLQQLDETHGEAQKTTAPITAVERYKQEKSKSVVVSSPAPSNTSVASTSNDPGIPTEVLPGFDPSAGKTWIYPTNYPLRTYQFDIVQSCLYKNTLVCLPTGLGKTFIAAVVMYNFYRWYPQGKIVFMAPTRPLVAQQIEACFNIMGIPQKDTAEMTGSVAVTTREDNWRQRRVFFLTPQVMMNDLARGLFPAREVKLLIVDEAHKAQGEFAYCQVARELFRSQAIVRIVALSATPGNDLPAVRSMLQNLYISYIELRNEESPDIVPYTNERKVEKIVVPLGDELSTARNTILSVAEIFVKRLSENKALRQGNNPSRYSRFAILKARDEFRQNPPSLPNPSMKGILECDFATCLSLYHGLELVIQHGLRPFFNFFSKGSDGSAESPYIQRTMQVLNRVPGWRDLMANLTEKFSGDADNSRLNQSRPHLTQAGTQKEADMIAVSHPKLHKLIEVVVSHFQEFAANNMETRVIIFSQYRDSVNEVVACLGQQSSIVKPMSFVGQAGSAKKKGLTQKQQIEVINRFRTGGYNTLVATSVGEEGLDIGEVDLIVLYDVSRSPIRLVQRMGRTGRKRAGRIVVLVTEGAEERKYNSSLISKSTISKAILEEGKLAPFLFSAAPRMVPKGLNPICQQMKMIVNEFKPKSGKDARTGKLDFKKKQKLERYDVFRKNCGFLSEAEEERWRTECYYDGEVKRLAKRSEHWCSDVNNRLSTEERAEYDLSEYSLWQTGSQSRLLVNESRLSMAYRTTIKLITSPTSLSACVQRFETNIAARSQQARAQQPSSAIPSSSANAAKTARGGKSTARKPPGTVSIRNFFNLSTESTKEGNPATADKSIGCPRIEEEDPDVILLDDESDEGVGSPQHSQDELINELLDAPNPNEAEPFAMAPSPGVEASDHMLAGDDDEDEASVSVLNASDLTEAQHRILDELLDDDHHLSDSDDSGCFVSWTPLPADLQTRSWKPITREDIDNFDFESSMKAHRDKWSRVYLGEGRYGLPDVYVPRVSPGKLIEDRMHQELIVQPAKVDVKKSAAAAVANESEMDLFLDSDPDMLMDMSFGDEHVNKKETISHVHLESKTLPRQNSSEAENPAASTMASFNLGSPEILESSLKIDCDTNKPRFRASYNPSTRQSKASDVFMSQFDITSPEIEDDIPEVNVSADKSNKIASANLLSSVQLDDDDELPDPESLLANSQPSTKPAGSYQKKVHDDHQSSEVFGGTMSKAAARVSSPVFSSRSSQSKRGRVIKNAFEHGSEVEVTIKGSSENQQVALSNFDLCDDLLEIPKSPEAPPVNRRLKIRGLNQRSGGTSTELCSNSGVEGQGKLGTSSSPVFSMKNKNSQSNLNDEHSSLKSPVKTSRPGSSTDKVPSRNLNDSFDDFEEVLDDRDCVSPVFSSQMRADSTQKRMEVAKPTIASTQMKRPRFTTTSGQLATSTPAHGRSKFRQALSVGDRQASTPSNRKPFFPRDLTPIAEAKRQGSSDPTKMSSLSPSEATKERSPVKPHRSEEDDIFDMFEEDDPDFDILVQAIDDKPKESVKQGHSLYNATQLVALLDHSERSSSSGSNSSLKKGGISSPPRGDEGCPQQATSREMSTSRVGKNKSLSECRTRLSDVFDEDDFFASQEEKESGANLSTKRNDSTIGGTSLAGRSTGRAIVKSSSDSNIISKDKSSVGSSSKMTSSHSRSTSRFPATFDSDDDFSSLFSPPTSLNQLKGGKRLDSSKSDSLSPMKGKKGHVDKRTNIQEHSPLKTKNLNASSAIYISDDTMKTGSEVDSILKSSDKMSSRKKFQQSATVGKQVDPEESGDFENWDKESQSPAIRKLNKRKRILSSDSEESDNDRSVVRNADISKPKNKKKKSLDRGCQFLDVEAELSGSDQSSQDEQSEDEDGFDSSFIDDLSQQNDHAMYLKSVRSPDRRNVKQRKLAPITADIFSQAPVYDEELDEYDEDDSFVVGSQEEVHDSQWVDTLDILEQEAEKVKRRGRGDLLGVSLEPAPRGLGSRKQPPQSVRKKKRRILIRPENDSTIMEASDDQIEANSSTSTPQTGFKRSSTRIKDSPLTVDSPFSKETSPPSKKAKAEKTSPSRPPPASSRPALDGEAVANFDLMDDFPEMDLDSDFELEEGDSFPESESLFVKDAKQKMKASLHTSPAKNPASSRSSHMASRTALSYTSPAKNPAASMSGHMTSRTSFDASPSLASSSTTGRGLRSSAPKTDLNRSSLICVKPDLSTSMGEDLLSIIVSSGEVIRCQNLVSSLRFHHKMNVLVRPSEAAPFILSQRMAATRFTDTEFMQGSNNHKLMERIKGMKEDYEKLVLIIEFEKPKPGVKPKEFKRTKYLDRMIAQLSLTQIKVLYCSGQEETADILYRLAMAEQEKGMALPRSLRLTGAQEKMVRWYQTLRGIGLGKAIHLATEFINVRGFVMSTVETIEAKGKLSREKAKALVRFFSKEFCSNPEELVPL